MKAKDFTDYRALQDNFGRTGDDLMDQFSDWAEELNALLEERVFGGQFKEILYFVMSINDELVSKLDDIQMEQQLTICSQYKYTFAQMRDELDVYISKLERKYRTWMAGRLMQARVKILKDQKDMYDKGTITKANISTTKEEVQNQFLVDNEINNNAWHNFIDKVKRARNLVKNVVEDMESRSMMLMSLRKRQNY